MDDRRARVLLKRAGGNQRGDRGRRDGLTPLVNHEAAVRVAVEGQADVGALFHGELLKVHKVLRVQRVRLVVGEGAVELEVQRADVHVPQHRRHCHAGHAVGRVHRDNKLAARGHRHKFAQVGGVLLQGVMLIDDSRFPLVPRHALEDHAANLAQAGVRGHRGRTRAAELDAVVLRRVVRGGEHGARAALGAGDEVELVGGRQAQQGHVDPLAGGALGEDVCKRRRGRAHVVADSDAGLAFPAQDVRERRASGADEVLVDGLADDAADVVRLDNALQRLCCVLNSHARYLIARPRHGPAQTAVATALPPGPARCASASDAPPWQPRSAPPPASCGAPGGWRCPGC